MTPMKLDCGGLDWTKPVDMHQLRQSGAKTTVYVDINQWMEFFLECILVKYFCEPFSG